MGGWPTSTHLSLGVGWRRLPHHPAAPLLVLRGQGPDARWSHQDDQEPALPADLP